MHFIGIDIGTTSICGIIYSLSSQNTAYININNEAGIDTEREWERIQDPGWIVTCVVKIIKKFQSKYQNIMGICITGQMHGIIYIDKDGSAVSPLYTWQDNRGNLILKDSTSYAEYLTNNSGYHLSTGYGLVTHFYNIKNSNIPPTAVKIGTVMDYTVMKLAGRITPLMDYTNAAGIGFFNVRENKFDIPALESFGIETSILPEIAESAVLAGYYESNIPVYSAIGDNQAGFIGSVRNREKAIHVTIGTSSQLSVYSSDYFQINSIDTRPFPGGGYLNVGAALSGGQSLVVLQSFFDSILKINDKNSMRVADFYQWINALDYKKNDPLSLSVTTSFNGSRSNPFVRGVIENISSTNLTAENLALGFVQGICNEIYDFYNLIPNALKANKNILIGSGNALKKNDLLCRVLEETFILQVVKSEHNEDAAFGASIAAAVGGEYVPDFCTILDNTEV